jgi:MFS family permease
MFDLAEMRMLDRRIWILAFARLVSTAGFSIVLPFLPMHLANERHVPVAAVGLIWTIAGVCGAVMQWVGGALSDRVGRMPLLMLSSFLRIVVLGCLGYATHIRAPVSVLALLVILAGVMRAFFDPPVQALVADLAPPERRVAAFSLQRIGVNIGFTAGPAVAALTAGVPYHLLFYWSIPVSLAAWMALTFVREPARSGNPPSPISTPLADLRAALARLAEDRVFVRFLLATFACFVLQIQLFHTLSIYAARTLQMSRGAVGTIYVVNGLLVVLLQLPAVAYINRWGRKWALTMGALGYAVSYGLVGLAHTQLTLLLCVAAVTVSEVILAPAQHAEVTSMAPAGRVGAYSGLFGLAQIAGQSVGPAFGGLALDAVTPRLAWPLLALFGVAAAFWYRSALTATPTHER